ncbi:MAG: rhodanese-like domain-containing protein [Succinivibrio sp.]|nr:rhodanese-like domain-containing protein [Succinivibrio sp.]
MSDLFSPENMVEYWAFFNRHVFLCGMWVVCLVMILYMQLKIMLANVKKLTTAGATMLVNHEEGLFVDVRAGANFEQSHIANSLNISAADIKAGKTQRIESAKDKPIILVGRDKMDSEAFNSARILKQQGFTKVFTLDGGIMQWANENLPLSNKK